MTDIHVGAPRDLVPHAFAALAATGAALGCGVALIDELGVVRHLDQRGCALLAVNATDVIDLPPKRRALTVLGTDGRPLPAECFAFVRAQRSGQPVSEVVGVPAAGGAIRWLSVHAAPVTGPPEAERPDAGAPEAEVPWVVVVLNDISGDVARVEEQHGAEHRLQAAFEQAPVAMALIGLDRRFARVNATFCNLLGRPARQLLGRLTSEISEPADREVSMPYIRRLVEGSSVQERWQKRYLHADGTVLCFQVTAGGLLDATGRLTAYVCQFELLTTPPAACGHRDEVTGLLDRDSLLALIDGWGAEASPVAVSLLAVHVHGVRAANSNHGHEIGDGLLRAAVGRLASLAPQNTLLARIDGTDFLLAWREQDAVSARLAARQAEAALAAPVRSAVGPLPLGCGLGLARVPVGQDAASLLANAQLALAASLAAWPSTLVEYQPSLRVAAESRGRREQQVRDAVGAGRVEMHLQPIIDMATGRIESMEALARLRDADGALLMPADFLAVAEQTGLIVPLGDLILDLACAQLAAWRGAGIAAADLSVKVNVSATQLIRPHAAAQVLATLARYQLPSTALGLEITESVLLDASAATLRQLTDLAAEGIALGIDDVGTGWSSVSNISRLPLAFLKLDRSFVSGLADPEHRRGDVAIVGALLALGRGAGLQVVAEGVEQLAEQAALLSLGGRLAQGYLYDRPLPPEQMAARLRRGRTGLPLPPDAA